MGVDTDELTYTRLNSKDEKGKNVAMPSEQVFELMKKMVTSDGFKVVVLDSVAALCPSKELEDKMGDQHYALVAKQMSKAMRVFTALNKSQGTIMVFINQMRAKIGIMWGNPNTTTGGKALPFYASLRMEVRRGEWYPKAKGAIAQEVIMKIKKDKIFGKLGADARFLLFFEDANIKYWDEIKDKKPKEEKDDD
jgi:recombination protein RecA